ncbi:anthranilate synthase component II [Conservatibacter flavescens]|nr:anthranilate synthase component II [Conservatibacter flavescens]
MQQILLIDHHDSFTYNLVDLLRKLNLSFHVQAVENVNIKNVADFSHIILSPGPDIPETYPQTQAILQHYYQQKSILGICLGHQMLCEFFGGHLFNLGKVRHGQQIPANITQSSPLFAHLPATINVGLYHSWAVSDTDFPASLTITARCKDNIIMAMQHKTLPIYGIQFHPESFMTEHGLQIIKNWLAIKEDICHTQTQ